MLIRKIKNLAHLLIAFLSNIIFRFPSRRIKVVGITGTDGKTTTTHMVYHILKSAGKRVSMISSVYAKIGEEIYETGLHTTTPGSFSIQKMISKAIRNKDEYFVLETTAHGLDQYRVWGTKFYIGLITNITHEHIKSYRGYDYFGTLDDYALSKIKLLKISQFPITNKDDKFFYKVKKVIDSRNLITYSLFEKATFNLDKKFNNTKLVGDFQKYNILASVSITKTLGIQDKDIQKALKTFVLPNGRFEVVSSSPITVIIDFAHTVNSINNVLKSIRENVAKDNNIIHVFGSAGLRDYIKREKMGIASGEWSNKVILTEEDYRIEDPYKICQEIAKGLEKRGFRFVKREELGVYKGKSYTIEIDRKKAINLAINSAKKKDVVVCTGKSHEKSLCRGNVEVPWNEHKAVYSSLKNYGKK